MIVPVAEYRAMSEMQRCQMTFGHSVTDRVFGHRGFEGPELFWLSWPEPILSGHRWKFADIPFAPELKCFSYRMALRGGCPSFFLSHELTGIMVRLEPLRTEHAVEMLSGLSVIEGYRFLPDDPPVDLAELACKYERQTLGRSEDGAELWHNWIVRDVRSSSALGYTQQRSGRVRP